MIITLQWGPPPVQNGMTPKNNWFAQFFFFYSFHGRMSQYSLRFTMCVCTIGFGCNYQIEVASLWFVCLPWQHLWVPLCLFICSVSTIGCKFDLTSRKRGVWSFNRSQTWGCFWRTHFFRFSSTHSHLVLSLPPLPLLMPTHWLLTDSHSTLLHP